jgi:hypothetical protein
MATTVLTTRIKVILADAFWLIQKKNVTIFWYSGTPLKMMGTGLTMIGIPVLIAITGTKTPPKKSLAVIAVKWENFSPLVLKII